MLLGLIHVDVMRERLFAFISRNYAREIPSVKAIINNNLCSVFYGGFLQQRILRQFDMYFRIEPVETRDNILDKLLLSIRTPDIQDQILAFIDKYYSIFTSAQKLKLCTTCHEMIPECDALSVRLIDLVNRKIATDRDIARILATGLCQSIDKSIKAEDSTLVQLLLSQPGFTEDVAVAYIVGNNNGVDILVSLLAEMPADKRAAKLIRATVTVPGITEESYSELLARFADLKVTVKPSTLYDVLEADKNAVLALTPNTLVAFRECIVYPAIRETYADAFDLELGEAGLDALVSYVDANPRLKSGEEYEFILDYIRMVEMAAGTDTEGAFDLAVGMPTIYEVRANIAEYMDYHHTASEGVAECTHKLLVSYLGNGKLDLDRLYSDYQRDIEEELAEKSGVLAKVSFCERRAAAEAMELVLTCVAGAADASNQIAFLACDEECGLKKAFADFAETYGIGAIGFLKKQTEDSHFALCDLVAEFIEERKSTRG